MRAAPSALLLAAALCEPRAAAGALAAESRRPLLSRESLALLGLDVETEEEENARLASWAARAAKADCVDDCSVDAMARPKDETKKVALTQINRGRLGNQLFQWAAMLAIAKEAGFQVVVRDLKYRPQDTAQMRGLASLVWEADDYAKLEQRPNLCHVWDQTPVVVDTGLPRLSLWSGWGQEKGTGHVPTGIRPQPGQNWARLWASAMVNSSLPSGTRCDIWELDGFFQQQWFFMDHMDLVREAFWHQPSAERAGEALKWLMYNEKGDAVGLHIRLGDYKYTNRNMPISYYIDALDKVRARSPNKPLTCVIFSDDIQEAMSMTGALSQCSKRMPVPPDLTSDSDAFYMLGLMPNIIIADSSFSFWAARLAPHNPFVVAPGITKDSSTAQSAYEYLLQTPGWAIVNTTTDLADQYKVPAGGAGLPAASLLAVGQRVFSDAPSAEAARNWRSRSEWAY